MTIIRTSLVGAAMLALAACGGSDNAAQDDSNPTAAENDSIEDAEIALGDAPSAVEGTPYADTAWEWTSNGGNITTTVLRADGSFSVGDAGGVSDQGAWNWTDGKVCFNSSRADAEDSCWTVPPQAPGVGDAFVVTNSQGENIELTRVDYEGDVVEERG
ncbi:hypothetical protein [Sphingomicrobium arenosum]|uniref:hypothetical protein n=1 Tax=Sphingomicrobium arenosum TaxID=2233861 RepID=UPI00223FAC23|nr:hypothetical protein [Sphingomicrobium arenosum]